ncbi:DegQ family serine endoprotease [Acidovorax sp. MR-S7]|uniref:DegQ family serine endoprotease n=1 Tax=Acidovorax sp. MR-S7 TaxID=1268622 RepID=UPI00037FFBD1|nr:DegQ family serine endoprotease [Acidovorax sp. MR-S7]GAD23725.1 trypsin-like serine proteases, typically periplasmic, contain C-terminal PDZ domain [Acidovorax sp. MR-S7]
MDTLASTPRRLILALVAAGALGATGAGLVTSRQAQAVAQPAAVPLAQPGGEALPGFAQITAQNGPAVVNISVSGTQRTALAEGDDDGPADPFQEFFRRFGMPQGMQMPRDVPVRGQGSGFIVSPDGVVLTNAHVVKNADEVTVKLTDRREFRAKVLGADPQTDVAVLKIDAKGLPTVHLGSTRALGVGEWVLAIGSPFGFENSVTAGVVSAKGRALPDDSAVPFIQTDVAVNPGNSGGPLFNARGEVVGINSQIYSRSGGYQGVSFAIPIEVAARVKDQILATGHASHARLGVTVQEVNQTLADSFGLDKPQGALVADVQKGGPADKAGLRSGDVIRSVDGQPIVSSSDLPAFVSQTAPGTQVRLQVWRHGRSEDVTATLGNAADKPPAQARADAAPGQGRLGLALRPLQPGEQREAGVEGGLLIEQASGPAARAGVQGGDVLLSVNGTPARDVAQVRGVVAKAGKSVALLVMRDGERIFVPVRLG